MSVPRERIREGNQKPVHEGGRYVLYWMIANRRASWNYSLDRALEWARRLNRPLVVLEALRCGYAWASDRLHHFVVQGMADNALQFAQSDVLYYPYLEPAPDAGKGLLEALAKDACLVVTDHFPAFFLPRMVDAAARRLPVFLEMVDANGLLPMAVGNRIFTTAHAFRRFLQKTLTDWLHQRPEPEPLKNLHLPTLSEIPEYIQHSWPATPVHLFKGNSTYLTKFPIDHRVGMVSGEGGSHQALLRLDSFLKYGLPRYADRRNQPEEQVTSGLSPYLHFGHISAHEVFYRIMEAEDWFFDRLSPKTDGSRSQWWGMSPSAEAFLDQLITWRELGFNMCFHRSDYDQYASLPDWARETLSIHEMDERPALYGLESFRSASTHDPLWNAAQTQLVVEGTIHNYLRMLWGKKILEWTETPHKALDVMFELNNRYALDGRDPNSCSGIFWTLGRYDRAWGERPVFGKIRYMSSQNTARKVNVKEYIKKYSPAARAQKDV